MTLTWNWSIALGITVCGFLTGYILGLTAWPNRIADHAAPPVMLALILGVTNGLAFFVPLTVFRIVTGGTAELQATVLYLVFALSSASGLGIRSRAIR